MKPEALSEDGGLLPAEALVVEGDKSIATSRGCDPWFGSSHSRSLSLGARHSTPRCSVASAGWRQSLSRRNDDDDDDDVVVYRREEVGVCVLAQTDQGHGQGLRQTNMIMQ